MKRIDCSILAAVAGEEQFSVRGIDERDFIFMKLKNVLIVANDIEKSIAFYKNLFGLEVILDNNGNVIMTEGLVLQNAEIWKSFLNREIIPQNNASELYFEESDLLYEWHSSSPF